MIDQKKLIRELLVFMRSGKRKKIMIEEYIKCTESSKKWTLQQKEALYSAIERTKVLSVTRSISNRVVKIWSTEQKRFKTILLNDTHIQVELVR